MYDRNISGRSWNRMRHKPKQIIVNFTVTPDKPHRTINNKQSNFFVKTRAVLPIINFMVISHK